MTSALLAERIRAGEVRAIARGISLVETGEPGDLLARLAGAAGRAFVVGVTGPPGAGKSTRVDRLIAQWRQAGRRVGVIAVDPSSPFSGGAILGDRVRMQAHAEDAGVFIRSMAARGHAGGIARATADAVRVLDAAGFDPILVETVGVGQAEVDIVRLADVSVVVLAPGSGDDVQAMKAGLMEIGDVFVVNKADREGADRAVAAIQSMLALDDQMRPGWRPPVIATVGTSGQGVAELAEALAAFQRDAADLIRERRRDRPSTGGVTSLALALDHVGVAVESPDRILGCLAEHLGLPVGAPEDVPRASVRVRFVGEPGPWVEVIESTSGDSAIAKFLAARGPGLHHIAYRVRNLDEAMAWLTSRGVRFTDDRPQPGAHGSRVAFIHPASAGGVLVELVERPARMDHADR